jgi:uncharacterized membrane protein
LFDAAFVYTQAEGMLRLDDLAAGDDASGAYAIDASGRIIAGFGSDATGKQALIWVDRKPVALMQLLVESGGSVPDGWSLLEVRAMSADGRRLVGNATNAEGNPEGFRVALPSVL